MKTKPFSVAVKARSPRRARFEVGFVVALLCGGALSARAQQTPGVGGIRLNDQGATSPCSIGQSCIWRNGAAVNFQRTDGTTVDLTSNAIVSVKAYGAKGNGTTDDTAAINAAVAAAPAGAQITFPIGNYLLTDTVTISRDRIHLLGAGVGATTITFNPSSAKAAIKVDNGGSVDRTYGGSIEGIYFKSGNTTQQKIAIDLVDTSGYTIRDVWVDPVTSATPPWRTTFAAGGGTVAVTNGNATVTGTSTSFSPSDIGKTIQIGSLSYLITGRSSSTSITIERGFEGLTSSGLSYYEGYPSVGIRARGRELTLIDNVRLWADTPILVDVDPYISSPVSCDHLHLSNSYLLSTPGGGNSNFKINDGVIVTNFTIEGDNAWIVDKYGLYWLESGGTPQNAQNVAISGIRMEQPQDLTGFGIYIDHTKGLQNLEVRNVAFPFGSNGMHLGGSIQQATIRNSSFPTNDATKLHLDIPGATKDLVVENVYWQINTLATLTNLTQTSGAPRSQSGAALPPSGRWSDSTTGTTVPSFVPPLQAGPSLKYTQTAASSGSPTAFKIVGGAHLTLATTVEDVGFMSDMAATKQWTAGNFSIQRENVFTAPTYSATGATTITGYAATVAIMGAPIAGTNMTIGNSYAMRVLAGTSRFDGNLAVNGGILFPSATVAAAASITLNPAGGTQLQRINLSATAITSLTVSIGIDGQVFFVEVVQDATGGRSIPTTWTNVAFPGGTYTVSAGANKHDFIMLVYNATLAKWIATVSLNIS